MEQQKKTRLVPRGTRRLLPGDKQSHIERVRWLIMQPKNRQELQRFTAEQQIALLPANQLDQYVELVEKWQQRTKLVSSADLSRIVIKHIADSYNFSRTVVLPEKAGAMDLGSGAGFPGIVVAVCRPDINMVLLESKRIRALFLREVVQQLGLTNAQVVCERAEVFGRERPHAFDVVMARAVADLAQLWEWTEILLKPTGYLLTQKGIGQERPVATQLSITSVAMVPSVSESELLLVRKGAPYER